MTVAGEVRRLTTALDPTSRRWAVLFTGEVLRMALGFLAGVLIARALGPVQFGVFVVLGAATAIGSVLVDFGLSQAAVVRVAGVWVQDQAVGHRRGQAFLWIRLATATAVTLPAVVFAGWLAKAIGLPETVGGYSGSSLLVLALAGVVASALSGAISTLLQATGRFGSIAVLLVTNTGLTLVLAAILIVVGRLDLVTALLVLGILPSLITFVIGRKLLGGRWKLVPPSREELKGEADGLFRIGGWLWVAGLLTALAVRLDLLLVNKMSGPEVVGAYGLAFSLAASVGAVGGSLYTVLLPAASALRDSAEYGDYLRRGFVRSAVLSLMLVPLVALARPVIVLVYGPEYASAAPLFQFLIPVAALELLVMPLMLLVVPLDVPQWLVAAGGLRVAVVAVLGWLLVPSLGPSGAIVARAASVTAGAGLVAVVLWRGRRVPWTIDPFQGYAKWAPEYPPTAHNALMAEEEAAMVRLLPDVENAVCLDLACGSGRYLRILAEKSAARVVGMDAVPQMLAEARRLEPPHELIRGVFDSLPFPDGVFDLVVCGLAVGHTVDLGVVVSEMARVLRPGGVVLYSDFHPEAARAGGERTFTADDGTSYRLEHHIHDVADHRQACDRAGLTIDAMVEPELPWPASSSGEGKPVALVVRAIRDSS